MTNPHLKAFSLRYERGQRCPFPLPLLNTALKVLAPAVRQEKEIKGTQTGKEEENLSPLQIRFCIQTIPKAEPKNKKLLEIINDFHKVTGYKINIHKSITFLHIKVLILKTNNLKTVKMKHLKKK